MLARIADDLRGRVEAHRLRVEQRGAKDVRMMMLHPAGRIGDLRKTRGVALGKAVTAEALDLLERTLGELFRIAALAHPPAQFVIEVRPSAGDLECRHPAATLFGLRGCDPRASDPPFPPLLLEPRPHHPPPRTL